MLPRIEVSTKLLVLSSTQSRKMPAGMMVAGHTNASGYATKPCHWNTRPTHEHRNMHTAVYVAPVGNLEASHWMYWSADGMMMNANGEMIGHHWRSFQSVQKSQSPANSSLVMSAAAPTTNAAVIQKTMSTL